MRRTAHGFTLIEMAIVLVIIGLVVGGVLAGQTLIEAASQRAQVTQIEKYRTAANTFYGKYGYLPGDLPPSLASPSGFVTRSGVQYEGDGNGIVETFILGVTGLTQQAHCQGEIQLFWNDLSTAKLIAENMVGIDWAQSDTNHFTMSQLFPPAAYNNSSHIVFYSVDSGYLATGQHYFQTFNSLQCAGAGVYQANGPFTFSGVAAGAIDRKIDDGNPLTGSVQATFEVGGSPTTSIAPYGGYCVDANSAYNQSATTNRACELAFRF